MNPKEITEKYAANVADLLPVHSIGKFINLLPVFDNIFLYSANSFGHSESCSSRAPPVT